MSCRMACALFLLVLVAGCGGVNEIPSDIDAGKGTGLDGSVADANRVDASPDAGPCDSCSNNATCINEVCQCKQGFQGNGNTCLNVNECATNNGGCDPDGICDDQIGTFSCRCPEQFYGDGFTCTAFWLPIFSDSNLKLEYWSYITGHNNSVFYGDASNFFREYSLQSGQVSDRPASSDFTGAGFTGTPVSVGGSIFEFGNDGQRYDGTAWTDVAYPEPRGEAGFIGYGGLLYRVGGRKNDNVDQSHLHAFDPVNLAWSTTGDLADYPWPSRFVGLGAWNEQIFGVGGATSLGNNKMAVYSIADDSWSILPNAPFEVYRPSVVMWDSRMFVLADSLVHVFDPASGAWSPNFIPVPLEMANAKIVSASGSLLIIGDRGSDVQILELTGYSL